MRLEVNKLDWVIIIGMWIIFCLLGVFVFVSAKNENFDETHTLTIRRVWYLVFLLGCLIILSKEPAIIFSDWRKFLVVLIAFIIVDSVMFLNLYVSKLAGQKLQRTKRQVGVTQDKYDEDLGKTKIIPEILLSFGYPVYNGDKERYVNGLSELLVKYGQERNLIIDLYPYRNPEEQDSLLENMGKEKDKVKRLLKSNQSFISSVDNLAIYPIIIFDESWVVQVQTSLSDQKVTTGDNVAILTLVTAYYLAVQSNFSESGEDNDSN